ncbi:MAG TPA: M48 family metallopeptidase [Actinomycetes bacterium]|nr:M48 family metallopeptidase [Actinomycetes bacterium]
MTDNRARMAALVVLALLAVALVVIAAVGVPWRTLPPIPGGRTQVDPATDFTAAEMAREDAFHRAVRPPAYLSLLIGLAITLLLGFTPWGAKLVGWLARPLGGGWGWQVLLGALAVVVIGRLATLPFDLRAESVLRSYGLSTQTWGSWTLDQLRGLGINLAVLLLLLYGLYGLVRITPRWWWIPGAVLGALLVVVISFLYPVLIAPVFNKFTPMPPGELRSSLLELARRDGIAIDDVLVADASKRTTRLNAYVSGIGSTRRIVVYDTALEQLRPEEIRSVVAHELGHVKHRDVWFGTALGALGMAAAVCLLYLLLGNARLLSRAGVPSLADARSVPLVLALVTVLATVGGPVQLLMSRRIEARADVHALDLTRDPDTFIAMQRRLAVANLSDLDPAPLIYGLFASHPTAPERIALARDWEKLDQAEARVGGP